jgi:hypothetical protein
MNPHPRRRLAWKILGTIVGAILLVVIVGSIWTSVVANRRAETMVKEIDALREILERTTLLRLPRRGEALEGNAWDDYAQALAVTSRAQRKEINAVYYGTSTLAPEEIADLLASGDSAFDPLRRGLRRRSGGYPYVWEAGGSGQSPSLFDCQTLGNFAALRAGRLLQEGKAREAADLMLDVCSFGRDLSYRAPLIFHMIAQAIYSTALFELREVLKSRDLAPADFEAIDRELELVGKEWPDLGDDVPFEVLTTGYELLKPVELRDPDMRASVAGSWRFGFSPRIAEADAFDELRSLARELVGISRRPWGDARRLSAELETRIQGNRNRLVSRLFQWNVRNIEADRELRTNLQLLRAAAQFRATGKPPVVADPYGDALRTELKSDRLKIWSVGPDGVDNGGSGDWRRKMGKDMVYEVSR